MDQQSVDDEVAALVQRAGLAAVMRGLEALARQRAVAAQYAGLSDDATAWQLAADSFEAMATACAARGF